jgi:hypothetical protein
VRHRYLSWVHHQCLVGGDFYAKEGMEAAIPALMAKLSKALEAEAPSPENSAQIITAVFGQQAKQNIEK